MKTKIELDLTKQYESAVKYALEELEYHLWLDSSYIDRKTLLNNKAVAELSLYLHKGEECNGFSEYLSGSFQKTGSTLYIPDIIFNYVVKLIKEYSHLKEVRKEVKKLQEEYLTKEIEAEIKNAKKTLTKAGYTVKKAS